MRAVVVIGLGELGSLFAQGFLRAGHAVFPVTRTMDTASAARELPAPELVLVAVAEKDLESALMSLPAVWRERVGLLQNELLPRDWQAHEIRDPSVAVVWFEKKPTTLVKELRPTLLHGPRATLLADALERIGVHAHAGEDLVLDLVLKNLYILTTNIAGLESGGTVGALWSEHRALAESVAREVLALQSLLVGRELPEPALLAGLADAIAADPDHASTGRSAPSRLARALEHARRARIDVPVLHRIARKAGQSP